jgi:hypothetical protein
VLCRSLAFLFPDAIVMGVAHMSSGRVTLNPMLDYVLAADDELILCRWVEGLLYKIAALP